MLSRRALLLGGLAGITIAGHSKRAGASLARALSLTELLAESQHVFIGTSLDSVGQWEPVGGKDRIVTYTRVRVEHPLDGRPPAATELSVRTLGGRAGNIGQIVFGEASLGRNVTAALFVEPVTAGVFSVTAMAQGHYPLVSDAQGVRRLRATAKELVSAPTMSAVVRLQGRTVVEVEKMLSEEMAQRAH